MAEGEGESRLAGAAVKGVVAKVVKDFAHTAEEPLAKDAERDATKVILGDGSRRTLEEQLDAPHVHPDNAGIVGADYRPFGDEPNAQAFREKWYDEHGGPMGDGEWRWPGNEGAVPGSEETISPSDVGPLDRIGGDRGTYFSPRDTPFAERGLPPDRLNFGRKNYDLNLDHPSLSNGDLTIERSTIEKVFGQPGMGKQIRFLHDKVPQTAEQLRDIWKIFT